MDSFVPTPGVEGSAELATQTALDLLLNMSSQRELPGSTLEVSETGRSPALPIAVVLLPEKGTPPVPWKAVCPPPPWGACNGPSSGNAASASRFLCRDQQQPCQACLLLLGPSFSAA